MEPILRSPTVASVAASVEANLFAFVRNQSRCSGYHVHEDAEMLWAITDQRPALFNNVVRARLADRTVDSGIDAAVARGRSRHVNLMWWIGPSSTPAGLGSRLQAHGFADSGVLPGMALELGALPLAPAPVPDLSVREVTDTGALELWSQICAVGFGIPDDSKEAWLDGWKSIGFGEETLLRYYLGWWKGEPVATSMVFFGAGVAGIYCVAVLPHARRQGIGAAITFAPLRDARNADYQVAVLQASKMGKGVYREIGFQEYCTFALYTWSEAEQQGPG